MMNVSGTTFFYNVINLIYLNKQTKEDNNQKTKKQTKEDNNQKKSL